MQFLLFKTNFFQVSLVNYLSNLKSLSNFKNLDPDYNLETPKPYQGFICIFQWIIFAIEFFLKCILFSFIIIFVMNTAISC